MRARPEPRSCREHADRHGGDEAVPPRELRAAFRHVPASPAVVTTNHHGLPVGLTVTSLRSVSAKPALVAFSVTRTASAWPALSVADRVLVHLLDQRHVDLCEQFAASGIDRFGPPVAYAPDRHGLPLLAGPQTVLACTVRDRHSAGDACLLVALVTRVVTRPVLEPSLPLVYADGAYHGLRSLPEERSSRTC